jgi:hypothetical protein
VGYFENALVFDLLECYPYIMVTPKKKRKGDSIQVAHSVLQDVIKIAEKPIISPKKKRGGKR